MAAALTRLAVHAQADLALEETALATLHGLASIGGPTAVEAALALRADPRPAFRRAAVQALAKTCQGEKATAALREASRDDDAGVAAAARTGLRRCAGPVPARQGEARPASPPKENR
jgi:hypothetical protein